VSKRKFYGREGSLTEIADDGRLQYGQSEGLHKYGIEKGYPPMAHMTVLVDFDDTIIEWGPLMGEGKEPKPGAIEALKTLDDRGYIIVIFTSRMSRKWARSVLDDPTIRSTPSTESEVDDFLAGQYEYVTRFMNKHGFQPAAITAEKVPAMAYIDDKAIGFRGDWEAVLSDALVK
jgi:hypothetical protein